MKTIRLMLILLAALFCVTVQAYASPFLICDPVPGAQYYKIDGGTWGQFTSNAQGDGSMRFDLATSPVGTTPLQVKACKVDEAWGEVCSVNVPFDLVRPSALTTPTKLRLSQ